VILKVTEFSFFRKLEGKVEKTDNTGGRSEAIDEFNFQIVCEEVAMISIIFHFFVQQPIKIGSF
jgi:hypothetical protein